MNKVMLVGRLARDPELRTTGTGKSVCSFSVAVDRRFKQEGQPTADFFTVTAWGRQAEIINQYLGKGRQIALSGRLQSRSYDAKDGTKRYVTEVVLEEFDFIGGRSEQGGGASDGGYGGNAGFNGGGYNNAPAQPASNMPLDMDDDFHLLADDEDVPF
ncbi:MULTISPECIES: single-stranded DNA-binding protein [Eubacterium]|uniref:Single-stranded DNA-binding protein n=1 Tax=Eubacterium barkeri TaxID=1528 RepID=A0A1H3F5E0_EUBBA|nr:single-stranded DNA-binding protein [Eubacterium barkeri]SDX85558.1 single-strand binding protein [Eubacterium barkeri]